MNRINHYRVTNGPLFRLRFVRGTERWRHSIQLETRTHWILVWLW